MEAKYRFRLVTVKLNTYSSCLNSSDYEA
uniref:Uncharacterized protein n=1 Tax=Arundo donax TaxID=35708 RepID=A0A0A9BWA5_ARUDO